MKHSIFVRSLTDAERRAMDIGLRSPDAFTLRRCQILLASARRERVPAIARTLGCDEQTVRNAIHAFNEVGTVALTPRSSRPLTVHAAFDADASSRLRDVVHRTPRDFGHATSLWTLELVAETAHAEGLTGTRVSGETVRATLARLGIGWKRAKGWITSPDPAYRRKKAPVTG